MRLRKRGKVTPIMLQVVFNKTGGEQNVTVVMLQVVFDEAEGEAGEWSWCGEPGEGRRGLYDGIQLGTKGDGFKWIHMLFEE